MTKMASRIERLERGGTQPLSAMVRDWLGWPLTNPERAIAAQQRDEQPDLVDSSMISKEARTWLHQ